MSLQLPGEAATSFGSGGIVAAAALADASPALYAVGDTGAAVAVLHGFAEWCSGAAGG